jgi:hypothetical protein
VVLRSGRLDIDVPERRADPIAVFVNAPKDLGVITTAGSATLIAAAGSVIVANRSGTTMTRHAAIYQPLKPGQMRRHAARARDSEPVAMLKAPATLHATSVHAALDGPVDVCPVSWAPVAGAVAYQVTLRQDGVAPPVSSQRVTSTSLDCGSLFAGPGKYTLAVSAIDKYGLDSAYAATRELRVIGVELPPGAYVSDGSVYLGPGQQARFQHIERVEMSYGRAGIYFGKASPLIGLHRDQTTYVSFRLAGREETLTLVLKSRALEADVELSPKTAVWPRASVMARVVLRGPARTLESTEPRMSVTVGVDPIELDWHRHGYTWTARIPSQSGRGPWVVRLEVTDQEGNALGRDFVEILRESPKSKKTRVP